MECFLEQQRDLGCFCAGAVAPKPALFGGTHPTPLKTVFSTLSTKLQTFYTINLFSDNPEGFALLLGQCAALRRFAQLTTPFLASGNAPKWGFFPKDRTYRAFFVLLHKRNFFRMVPKGLNAFGTFVHAAESAIWLFSAFWG